MYEKGYAYSKAHNEANKNIIGDIPIKKKKELKNNAMVL